VESKGTCTFPHLCWLASADGACPPFQGRLAEPLVTGMATCRKKFFLSEANRDSHTVSRGRNTVDQGHFSSAHQPSPRGECNIVPRQIARLPATVVAWHQISVRLQRDLPLPAGMLAPDLPAGAP
jgi:hypothetical protein